MLDSEARDTIRQIASERFVLRYQGLEPPALVLTCEVFRAITEVLPKMQTPPEYVAAEVNAAMTAEMREKQALLLDGEWVPVALLDLALATMHDIRDESGALLLRYNPEMHIIEILDRHYDKETRKYCRRRRRIHMLPSGYLELLPV